MSLIKPVSVARWGWLASKLNALARSCNRLESMEVAPNGMGTFYAGDSKVVLDLSNLLSSLSTSSGSGSETPRPFDIQASTATKGNVFCTPGTLLTQTLDCTQYISIAGAGDGDNSWAPSVGHKVWLQLDCDMDDNGVPNVNSGTIQHGSRSNTNWGPNDLVTADQVDSTDPSNPFVSYVDWPIAEFIAAPGDARPVIVTVGNVSCVQLWSGNLRLSLRCIDGIVCLFPEAGPGAMSS